MTDSPTILQYQQGNDVAPPPDGFEHITNPLNPLLRSASRLAHFTDGVYDLSAESHIIKLLKAFLGDAGVGGAQKAMLLVRLQQSLGGTHFFDLDAFYGGIFGIHRAVGEHLALNPHTDLIPASTWDQIRMFDGSYRSRAARLSQAIQLGATPDGVLAVAEALTGIEFELIEGWMYPAYKQNTWDFWEAGSWDAMEAFTFDQLEWSETATTEVSRNVITLYPHEVLSPGEMFDLERALDRIKPASVIVRVFDGPIEYDIRDVGFSAISDSEKWEIRQLVRNNRINGILPYPNYPEDQFIEPPTVAFANYQGEAWTVLDRNPKVLAYYTDTAIDMGEQIDITTTEMPPQAFLSVTGSAQTVSLPEFALKHVQGLYAGRSVSDGIILINPFGDRDNGQTSSMLVDMLDIDFAASQIQSSARKSTQFWTTPIRAANDPASDVIEIRFNDLQVVNHLSFQYARFPCSLDVQAWDRGVGSWVSVGSIDNRESSPYGIGNVLPADAVHPYHYGADHWAAASLSFDPTVSSNWRIVCTHKVGTGPVGISGTPIPYPLGIRDLDLGYRVNSRNQVPHVSPMTPINSGRNIIGLQTNYFFKRALATYVEDALPTAWISEPQPIRDAVVNMYLKLDSASGAVVNQIYVDPVHPGVVANMYYTMDVPIGSAAGIARDDVVTPLAVVGSVDAQPTGALRGLTLGNGQPAWVDIDLHAIGGDAVDMWLGREYVLDDVMNMETTNRASHLDIISMTGGQAILMHGLFLVGGHYTYYVDAIQNGVRSRVAWPTDVIPARGARLRVYVHFNNATPVILCQIDNGSVIDSRAPINLAVNLLNSLLVAPVLPVGVERFGSATIQHSFARLTLAVDGYGSGPDLAFFDDPTQYAFIPLSGVNDRTRGTFLRFYPDYIGWDSGSGFPSIGFVGGLPNTWELAEWIPLGQFVVSKGVITFPDTRAVAFKLEFTNLIAEPYESFIPINTTVSRIANPTPESQGWSRTALDQATISLQSPSRFQDAVSGVSLGQDALTNNVSPTTGIVAIDGTTRDHLGARLGFGYNLTQWQVSGRSPIQPVAGVHTYMTTDVQGVSRTAFFVGLRSVQLRRKINRSLGDGKGYDDSLLDVENVDTVQTTFSVEPGQMFTPDSALAGAMLSVPRVGVSRPYLSRRPVIALQFATQQTESNEVIPDDEFRDPRLIYSDFSDPNLWHSTGDGVTFWDQAFGAVRVSRNPSVLQTFYAPDTPIVHPPVSPVLASGFARTVTLNFNSFGGIGSPMVSVSPRGVLYVGCRVAAWNQLQGPLALRLYGSDGTTVLMEKQFTPQVNVPAEVVMAYILTNSSIDAGIQVRVEQVGPYRDSWLMYSLSAFDTSTLWEFSVDDGASWTPGYTARGLKWGVVQFPTPGSALRWKVTAYRYNTVIDQIRLRPWYQVRLGSEI